MITTRFTLLAVFSLFITNLSLAQRGKEGTVVAPAGATVVNTYTYLTADVAIGSNTFTVNSNLMNGGAFGIAPLAAGDLLMIIQMQGASMDIDTTPIGWPGTYTVPAEYLALPFPTFFGVNPQYWGQVTDYEQSGLHERVEVLSVSGANTITLNCNLVNSYDFSGHVQVVRIPRYVDFTVNAGSTIAPGVWNGNSGGIVALEVDGTLTVNGTISANAAGFRGGQLDPDSFTAAGPPTEVRYLGSNDFLEGSEKGEGIGGFYTEYDIFHSRYGIGAPANGGGGGGYQNTGGGGGSNVQVGGGAYTGRGNPQGYSAIWDLESVSFGGSTSPGGGRGGYAYSNLDVDETVFGPRNAAWGGDDRKTNGGFGGHPLLFVGDRIWFGGGGGAGDQDSQEGGAGGRGGGLVFMNLYGSIVGSGTISARGQDGQNSNPTGAAPTGGNPITGEDGAGGGGAGGTIHIENVLAFPGTMLLDVHGGDGGDQDIDNLAAAPDLEAGGPGGSGSGGYIRITSGAPIKDLTAGANGTTESTHMVNFPPNGATEGSDGFNPLPANPAFNLTLTDVSICSGNTASLTAVQFGIALGTVTWFDAMVGGTVLGTGLNYMTPPLFATTTYWVGVCPGSFREPVTVTILPPDDASFNYSANTYCSTDADQAVTITGLAGGGFTVVPAIGLPVNAASGWLSVNGSTPGVYTVTYTTTGPCPNSSDQIITITALDNAGFNYSSASYCSSEPDQAVTITGEAGGSFSIVPAIGLAVNSGTGLLSVNGSTPGVYTVAYTTLAPCSNTSNQVITITALDDASFNYSATSYCAADLDQTVTITGEAGGSFSVVPAIGLPVNVVSGLLSVNGATPGVYNVTYTTLAPCSNASNVVITITALDNAGFNYSAASYCSSELDQAVTITGEAGGSFSIVPAIGLAVNSGTGLLSVNGSTPGVYTVAYTTLAPCSNTSNQVITITALDDASFNYSATSYCAADLDQTVTITGEAGGSFSVVPAIGLPINVGSGLLSVNGATPGVYNVTYTTLAPCSNASNVVITITALDDASFNYSAASYCSSELDQAVTITGLGGGGFTISPLVGLPINSSTGLLSVNAATAGVYTITYTTIGPCPNASNQVVTIDALDDATFNYDSPTYCALAVNPTPLISGLGGGGFSSSPAGLIINAASGVIDLSASTVAVYNVTYTTSGVCPNVSSVSVEVLAADNVSFTTTPTCDGGSCSVPVTTGGTFTFTVAPIDGASIDPITGLVTGGTSGTTYNITYTTVGACGASFSQPVTALLSPVITPVADLTACDSYALPAIVGTNLSGNEAYFDNSQAAGGVLLTGLLTSTQTIYMYDISSAGCSNETSYTVTIIISDDASFILTDFCDGFSNEATNITTPGGSFAFNPAVIDGATIDATTGEVTNGIPGTTYAVEYITSGLCPASSTELIIIFAIPLAPTVSGDLTYCSNVPFLEMSANGGAGTLYWYDDIGLSPADSISTGGSFIPFNVAGATTYYVNETENGCIGPENSIIITVEDCEVIIPTAFTPDGDGANDDWELLNLDNVYPNNVVKVYNRWGNLIFESVRGDYDNNRWDGTYKGNLLPVASYFYIIEPNFDGVDPMAGSISIILN